MAKDDLLKEAHEAFDDVVDYESDNRKTYEEDVRFARMDDQWPSNIIKERKDEDRPALTINKLKNFIRQVVNDNRQNKPQVKVHPVDSGADVGTAKLFSGIIRQIEYSSDADVAYDTGVESAVSGGFGYWRVGLDYPYDDSFDKCLTIDRIADPMRVYGDPASLSADSGDWNTAFVIERMSKREFEHEYKGADKVNWESDDYKGLNAPWIEENMVQVAEWWKRSKVKKQIVLLSDGSVIDAEKLAKDAEFQAQIQSAGLTVQQERETQSYAVKQIIMSGAEVLDEIDWAGCYIPIVPVYGDEIVIDGKRYFRSLIHSAKDAQRMFNYWRTASTELIALAPKAPFIGPVGSFTTDATKWSSANRKSHPFIEYDVVPGGAPPQRQAFAGVPAGVLQEALNASDDMKAIIGMYDASLGARSNETSGRAIIARQREGDTATFHFSDNVSRAIRCTGRILIDMIPKVYGERQMMRIIGEDGTPTMQQMRQPVPVTGPDGKPQIDPQTGQVKTQVFDLSTGRYDLTVTSGPSFTTRREEAAYQMTELLRAFPQAAPVLGDLIAKNLDWPGADEIAERLKALLPPAVQGGPPPEMMAAVQKMQQEHQATVEENQSLKEELLKSQVKESAQFANVAVKREANQISAFKAETDRFEAVTAANQPHQPAQYKP